MFERFLEELPNYMLTIGMKVVLCILVVLIGKKAIGFIQKILVKSMRKADAEEGVVLFMSSFVKAALYFLLFFFLLSAFGVDTASIIAVVGSAGVAIGLAVQGSLSNLAGGVLILLTKPFVIGDYIREGKNGNEGTVTDIQIFYTKLTTVNNEVVILPNGELANSSLTNMTGNKDRRVDIKVGVSYQADLEKTKNVLMDVLEKDPKILKDKDYRVFVDELSDSSVNMVVRCFFSQEDYWEGKWRLTEKVKIALDENQISIPYPQLDVHMFRENNKKNDEEPS